MGEETCRMFSRVHGLRVSIMRPANIFGVPVASTVNRLSLVPMCFVRDALKEGRLVLKSSGLQRRNFISVSKVAEACVHASLQPCSDLFAIYNVCSAWEVSIREIADMTCEVYLEIFGKALPIEVKSELPSSSTGFTASSRLNGNQIGVNDMRASMKSTIASLFNQMSQ
jgi:UDP-glucose 4-epimerase